MRFLEFFTVEL